MNKLSKLYYNDPEIGVADMIKLTNPKERIRAFTIIKVFIVSVALFVVVIGIVNNSLNINLLFLLTAISFFASSIENYLLKNNGWNFIVDTISALMFLIVFFII